MPKPISQTKRLVISANLVDFIKNIRKLSETELLGHLGGFYVYAAKESGATLEQTLKITREIWGGIDDNLKSPEQH